MGNFSQKLLTTIKKLFQHVRMHKKTILAVFVIFTIMGVSFWAYRNELESLFYRVNEEEKADFNELTLNYEQSLWGVPDRSAADILADSLKDSSDGYYFNDLDYDDVSRASWNPISHIRRLLTM